MEEYIERIEESNIIDGLTKLKALCEIDLMSKGHNDPACFDRRSTLLLNAFCWDKTPQGHYFWSRITDTIYKI